MALKQKIPCPRCGGKGWIPRYYYNRKGICFRCWGAKYIYVKVPEGKTVEEVEKEERAKEEAHLAAHPPKKPLPDNFKNNDVDLEKERQAYYSGQRRSLDDIMKTAESQEGRTERAVSTLLGKQSKPLELIKQGLNPVQKEDNELFADRMARWEKEARAREEALSNKDTLVKVYLDPNTNDGFGFKDVIIRRGDKVQTANNIVGKVVGISQAKKQYKLRPDDPSLPELVFDIGRGEKVLETKGEKSKQEVPKDRNSFTVNNYNGSNTHKKGDKVSVMESADRRNGGYNFLEGEIVGISHARQKARIKLNNGAILDFGFGDVYKPDQAEEINRKEGRKQSKRLTSDDFEATSYRVDSAYKQGISKITDKAELDKEREKAQRELDDALERLNRRSELFGDRPRVLTKAVEVAKGKLKVIDAQEQRLNEEKPKENDRNSITINRVNGDFVVNRGDSVAVFLGKNQDGSKNWTTGRVVGISHSQKQVKVKGEHGAGIWYDIGFIYPPEMAEGKTVPTQPDRNSFKAGLMGDMVFKRGDMVSYLTSNYGSGSRREYGKVVGISHAKGKATIEGENGGRTEVEFLFIDKPEKSDEYLAKQAKESPSKDTTKATTKSSPKKVSSRIGTFTISEDAHTKTGEKIWVTKLKDSVSKEDFARIKEEIRSLGGYYSRFKKGFIFKEDPTEKLRELPPLKVLI